MLTCYGQGVCSLTSQLALPCVQDTVLAFLTEREPLPGTIPPAESLQHGWYPHTGLFRWPVPKDPQEYKEHAKRPSDFRCRGAQARGGRGERGEAWGQEAS